MSDNVENESVPLTKEKKLKKPKTEKQMEAFKKVVEKRRENIEKKKLEKKIEASKLLLQNNIEIPSTKKETIDFKQASKVKQLPKTDDDEYEEGETDSEASSEEEIIVKKQQKPKSKTKNKKKKVTKVVYVEHASSDESSSGSEEEEAKHARQRHFTSQRNKKSLVKVQAPAPVATRNFINYFAD